MTPNAPISNVFCVRPRTGDVGDEAVFLVVRHYLREAFGPWVNVVSVDARRDGHGPSGITSRTAYELGLFGHGVVLCGGAPLDRQPWLELDCEALEDLPAPLWVVGWPDGMEPWVIEGLARKAVAVSCLDARSLRRFEGHDAALSELGGCATLFADRAMLKGAVGQAQAGQVLLVVRDPMRTPLHGTRRTKLAADQREVARLLRARHPSVRMLAVSDAGRHLAASIGDLDYLYTEDAHTWHDLLRQSALVVSFRAETALACAGLGVPFVHVACGDDGLGAMAAAGLDDWSIDLQSCSDIPGAVSARLDQLGSLETKRLTAMGRWGALDRALAGAAGRFAEAVVARRRGDDHRQVTADAGFLPASDTAVFNELGKHDGD